MQFSPTRAQKISCAYRNYIQKKLLKEKITPEMIKRIKAINIFDMLFLDIFPQSTDIEYFCRCILSMCNIELIKKGAILEMTIMGNGHKKIDRKIFMGLLLEAAKNSDYIKINIKNEGLEIISDGSDCTISRRLARRLGGKLFRINKLCAISIPIKNGVEAPNDKNLRIESLLKDPLSPIKIYLA